MSTHVNQLEQTNAATANIAPTTGTAEPAPGEVWTVERIRGLGVTTTVATAASVLGVSRSEAYRLVATNAFPAPVIRAGSRIVVPVVGLLRLVLADPGPAPDGRGLDPGRETGVDATTTPPADHARHRWRLRTQRPGGDE